MSSGSIVGYDVAAPASHAEEMKNMPGSLNRRTFLQGSAALAAASVSAQAAQPPAGRQPTQFQVACMTLPYSPFPLERALRGIQGAGYRHVAWGTSHRED